MFNRLLQSVMGAPAVAKPFSAADVLVSTPDALLIGSVREALLANMSDWKVTHSEEGPRYFDLPPEKYRRDRPAGTVSHRKYERDVTFIRKERSSKGKFLKPLKIVVSYEWQMGISYNERAERYPYHGLNTTKFTINDVQVYPASAGYDILKEYVKLRFALIETDKAAAKALKNMQENEKKWDLFEELTGMKRDGNGRLVAVSESVAAAPEPKPKRRATKNPFHPHCCEVDASGETCLCVPK